MAAIAQCIAQAHQVYGVPPALIRSVMHVEGGGPGVVHRNNNGTEDLGWMQINSTWLPRLKRYGYTRQVLLYNACANIGVGAWILRQSYLDQGDWTKGIAEYNAGSKLWAGRDYAYKVIVHWNQLATTGGTNPSE